MEAFVTDSHHLSHKSLYRNIETKATVVIEQCAGPRN
jgi:hypothetical protein